MGENVSFFFLIQEIFFGNNDFKFHLDKGRQAMLQRTEENSMAVNTSVSVYEMKPAVSNKNRQVNKAEDTDSKRHRCLGELRILHWTGQRDGRLNKQSWETGKLDPVEDSSHSLAANIKTRTRHFIFVCVLSKLEWRNIQHKNGFKLCTYMKLVKVKPVSKQWLKLNGGYQGEGSFSLTVCLKVSIKKYQMS